MLGGTDKDCLYIKSVYTCSLSALLQSCDISFKGRLKGTSLVNKTSLWRQLADLPLIRSTYEYFHGKLLAFGGYDRKSRNSSTAVYTYNSTTNSWDVISHMTTGRCACFTAVLPDNQLVVLGGLTGRDVINTVEIASVYISQSQCSICACARCPLKILLPHLSMEHCIHNSIIATCTQSANNVIYSVTNMIMKNIYSCIYVDIN